MNIAYSCDEMYIPQTGISILSLLENNKEIDHINIYFIEKEVSNISINLLEELVKSYGRKLIVISFNELCIDLKINNLGRHIETVYAKLFFSSILEINKIIYIDFQIYDHLLYLLSQYYLIHLFYIVQLIHYR